MRQQRRGTLLIVGLSASLILSSTPALNGANIEHPADMEEFAPGVTIDADGVGDAVDTEFRLRIFHNNGTTIEWDDTGMTAPETMQWDMDCTPPDPGGWSIDDANEAHTMKLYKNSPSALWATRQFTVRNEP